MLTNTHLKGTSREGQWFSLAIPVMVCLFLWRVGDPGVTTVQFLLATALLCIGWSSYLTWRSHPKTTLPTFALMTTMFWVSYGLPCFLEERSGFQFVTNGHILGETAYTKTMLLVLAGVGMLWLGLRAKLMERPLTTAFLINGGAMTYLRMTLVVSCLLVVSNFSIMALGKAGQGALGTIIGILPSLCFAIFLHLWLLGQATAVDKGLVVLFAVLSIAKGLASGWLHDAVLFIIVAGLVLINVRRKMPVLLTVCAIFAVMFLQAGKSSYRRQYWNTAENVSESTANKAGYWFSTSTTGWLEAIQADDKTLLRQRLMQTIERVSLFSQTANVIEMTPDIVPYQGFALYKFVVVNWVPRFLWKDKPTVNEANWFYQKTYLHQSDNGLNTSIAVGFLAEAYISFGTLGVLGVLFLTGLMFRALDHYLFSPGSGAFMQSVGIVALVHFTQIESQMASYVGSLPQMLLPCFAVYFPALQMTRINLPAWLGTRQPAPALQPSVPPPPISGPQPAEA